jgi:hypothetical protein
MLFFETCLDQILTRHFEVLFFAHVVTLEFGFLGTQIDDTFFFFFNLDFGCSCFVVRHGPPLVHDINLVLQPSFILFEFV